MPELTQEQKDKIAKIWAYYYYGARNTPSYFLYPENKHMNDRPLHDDTHHDVPEPFEPPEPEQPTQNPEILIELIRRVSDLERKMNDLERKVFLSSTHEMVIE